MPETIQKLRVLDLFSGILVGGFSLGLERTGGFETVAFCENAEFPRRVIRKHWPKVPIYEDVRTLTADRLVADGIAVDVITGGFPCQDISTAGRQAGIGEGTRSGLWSEIVRLACELRPRFIIVENVANLLAGPSDKPGAWFGRVLGDLAEIGFDAEWDCISAANIGAPHNRERVWLVAYPASHGWSKVALHDLARNGEGQDERWASINAGPLVGSCSWQDWEKQSGIRLVIDGFPAGLHWHKALGNAVVPQIPELIGRAILSSMKEAA